MPIYGVRTDKRLGTEVFSNRYFVSEDTLAGALLKGVALATAEKNVFGEEVTFFNVHAWIRGVTPNVFDNQPVLFPGEVTAPDPMKPEICGVVTLASPGTYPNTKLYRLCLNAASHEGFGFNSSVQALLVALADQLFEFTDEGWLVTKTGTPYSSCTANAEYEFRQLSKRWYNRGS